MLENIKNITCKNDKYVFSGSKPLKSIKNRFHKAKCLAGIDKRFRFHDLGRTVASRLVTESGIDIIMAAKILGHSDLKMLECYAHTRKDIEMKSYRDI